MRPIICLLTIFTMTVEGSNILAIIPFPSVSHQRPLLAVCKELALRGHNLTVITTDPPKEVIPNFTVIDVSATYSELKKFEKEIGFSSQKEYTPFEYASFISGMLEKNCDVQLSLPVIKEFIRNAENTKYDLVIIENLLFSSYLGILPRIGNPPIVAIYTFVRFGPTDWLVGIPPNPSYIPDLVIDHSDEMSFFERVYNTIIYWYVVYHVEMWVFPAQERVLRKHFGDDCPSARELEQRKSIVFKVSNLAIDYAVPEPPNVIEVGPLHITPTKPLPKDLQEWIDGAKEGVIYMSFGSNKKSSELPEEKRQAFVKAFAEFPNFRFLWKWETDEKIPDVSDNVLTRKWFPQQDVLASPKLRAVIYHGGLQSTQELIHHGVPTLGIPFYGDQKRNIKKLSKEGAGVKIDSDELTTNTVYNALNKLLHDKSYKENAMRLSHISRDQIVPGIEKAIWWTEYVIRNKGAKHLTPGSLKLHWFQLKLLDVYLFLLAIPLITCIILWKILKIFISTFSASKKPSKKNNKKSN